MSTGSEPVVNSPSPETRTTTAPSTSTTPSGTSGQLRKDLRSVGYEKGAQLLKPPPTSPEAVQVGDVTIPKGAPVPAADPTRDPDFRKRTLSWANGKIDRINDLMSYGAFDWAITDGEATEALSMLESIPTPNRLVVVQQLNSGKAVSRLIDNAPGSAKARYPGAYVTIGTVAGSPRVIAEVMRRAPTFLSPATDVQLLIRLMGQVDDATIREQAGYQAHAQGKGHFPEWLAITPDPPQRDLARRFGEQTQAVKDFDKAKAERAAKEQALAKDTGVAMQDAAFRSAIDTIQDLLSYSAVDWAITDAEARKAFHIFSDLYKKDPHQVQMAAWQLDSQNAPFMDRFLDNLSPGDRWGENKRAFLHIVTARKPERNIRFVKELLSTGVFDWAVTSEEAKLAFNIIKTMPRDVQDAFRRQKDGEWWATMEGELDQREANDKDAHLYDNDEEAQQRMLDFGEQCAEWSIGQLQVEIEMLCRMGKDEFVEKTLLQKGLDKDPKLAPIYEKYGFAQAGRERDEKKYATWREQTSRDRKDRDILKTIGHGLVLLGQAGVAATKVGVTGQASVNIDLQGVQEVLGGDISGIVLDKGKGEGDNRIELGIDLDRGHFSLKGQQISIASLSTFSNGTSLQTGPIGVTGVDVDVKWATQADPATFLRISIPSITARDVWQITDKRMSTVSMLAVKGLKIEAKHPAGLPPKDQAAGIGAMLSEVKDTVTRLLAMLKGVRPQPDQLATALGATMTGMEASVSIDGLEANGIGTSDGGFIGGAKVGGLTASIQNRRKGDVARERLAALETQGKEGALTAEEQAERADLEKKLAALAPLEAREAELVAKIQHYSPVGLVGHAIYAADSALRAENMPNGVSPSEHDELARLRSELTVTTAELGVESLAVTDVSMGGMKAKDVSVAGLRAQVVAAPKTGAADSQSDVSAMFSIQSASATAVVKRGGNQLEEFEGRVAELQAKIRAGTATADEVTLERRLSAQVSEVHTMVVVSDRIQLDPTAEATLTAEDKLLLDRARKELPAWVGRQPDTKIAKLALTGEGAQPAVSGRMDLSGGTASVAVANAHLEGYESGGRKVDSADAKGVGLSVATQGGGLLGDLASAHFKADDLAIAGYEDTGEPPSAALAKEKDALDRAQLLGRPLTPAQVARLGELPALIAEARGAEARLAELRALQKSDPKAFTASHAAELKALSGKYDATYTKVARIHATQVTAGLDTAAGAVTFGVSGQGQQPGVEIEGVEKGHLENGEQVTDQRIRRASADALSGAVKGKDGRLPDMLAISQGKQGFSAALEGRNIRLEGMDNGADGKGSGMRLDSGRIDALRLGYDSEQNGGQLGVHMEGAELKGLAQSGSSKLEGLKAQVMGLERIVATGGTLNPRQMVKLEKARKELAEYEKLALGLAKPGTKAHKAAIRKKLDAFTKPAPDVTVDRLAATDLDLDVTGMGNVLDKDFNLDHSFDVKARSQGKVEVEGAQLGGTSVKRASAENLDLTAHDPLSETERQIAFSADKVDAAGFKSPGAYAAAAHARKVRGSLNGNDLNAAARHASISDAGAGGNSIGYAGVSDVKLGIGGMGTGRQSVNASWSAIDAKKLASRQKGMTATVGALKGKKGSVAISPGGKVHANISQFSGSDVLVQKTSGTGKAKTVDSTYAVGSFSGSGANLDLDKQGTRASIDHFEAKNSVASGKDLGGRTVEVQEVTVNGAKASMGQDGTFDVSVKDAGVQGVRFDDGKGGQSEVESIAIADVAARGNAKDKVLEQGAVGKVEVRNAHINDDGRTANLDLGVVNDVRVIDANLADPAHAKAQVHVGSGHIEGLDASLPGAGGAVTDVSVREGGFEGLAGRIDGSDVSGSLASAHVKDAKGTQTTADGQRTGSATSARAGDVTFGTNLATGDFRAGVGSATVEKGAYTERGSDGRVKTEASADLATVKGVRAGGNTTTGTYDAAVDSATLTNGRVSTETQGGIVHRGSAAKIDVRGASARVDATGATGQVKSVRVKDAGYSATDRDGNVKTWATVDAASVDGASARLDSQTGVTSGELDHANVTGAHFATSTPDGTRHRGHVGSLDVSGVRGHADRDGNAGVSATKVVAKDLGYTATDKTGATVREASAKKVTADDLVAQTNGKDAAVGFRKVEGTTLHYRQGTAGQAGYVKVDTDSFKAGDGKDMSQVLLKADGTIDANIKAIELGPSTRKDGTVQNTAEWVGGDGKAGSLRLEDGMTRQKGRVKVGEVRLRDFNPGELTNAKSSLQVFGMDANHFILNTDKNTVYGERVKLEAAFVQGLGGDRMQAGYKGLQAGDVRVFDHEHNGEQAYRAQDIRSSGGFAILEQAPDKDVKAVYAELKDATAGRVQAKIYLPPQTYAEAQADYQRKLRDPKKPYDPTKDRNDFGVLNHASGRAKATYWYNEDTPGIGDDIGAFFIGRSASASAVMNDGRVPINGVNAGMDQLSLLGTPADAFIAQPLLGLAKGGALPYDLITGGVPVGDALSGAKDPADHYKRPEAPNAEDYTHEGVLEGRKHLSRLEVDAKFTNLGGDLQLGRDFKGRVDPGASVEAKGKVGESVRVLAKDLGVNDIQAMDGDVKADRAAVDQVKVEILDVGSPNHTRMLLDVRGTRVTSVTYAPGGAPDVDRVGANATYDQMTKR